MGPRTWATFGNILRIYAVFCYLGVGVLGYQAIQLRQHGAPEGLFFASVGAIAVSIIVALLFWNAKGPLIRGNLIVQFLVGASMLLWVISTLGIGLIFIGIVYLCTGEPSATDVYSQRKERKPHFKTPSGWRATGRVGPSGAMLYSDAQRQENVGMFNSGVPVQVMDKRNGFARVVAATGESGWIDLRVLTEGA